MAHSDHPGQGEDSIGSLINNELGCILESLREVLNADLLTILTPSGNDQALAPIASLGFDPEIIADFRLVLSDATRRQILEDVAPVLVNDVATSPISSPLQRLTGIGTLAIIPLTMHERLLGLLHVASYQANRLRFDNAGLLRFAGEFAALALDRANLEQIAASQQSSAAATQERLSFLAITSGLISSSLDYETTLSQITGMLIPKLADVCAMVLVDDNGRVTEVTTDGVDPGTTRIVRDMQSRYTLRLDSRSKLRRVLRTGRTEFHPFVSGDDLREVAANEENFQLLDRVAIRSMVIVPLKAHGKTIGALAVVYLVGSGRHYTYDDVEFVEELAHRAALAVEHARLYHESQRALEEREEALRFREETLQSERAARARAEAAQRREAFLSEASNVLSTSLDYATTLKNLARLVVARFASWCTIDLVDDAGTITMVAHAHANPDHEALLGQFRDTFPNTALPELPPRHVLRYREPTLIDSVPADFWDDSDTTPAFQELIQQFETHSVIVIPLFVRDRSLGVMIFGRSVESPSFDRNDLALAANLGNRAALAIDNSQLYNSAQEILRLQEEFISTASHELKTPLTTVKGYLQLINRQLHREDQSPARIVRFTQELEEQVGRLENLVSDLLDVSRIQQGHLELRLEQFDLAELAANVLSRFEFAPERTSRHELVMEAPESIIGIWDRGRIDQVLTNLISNALKYSPDGGEVQVRVRRTTEFAKIVVRDSGIGIKAEERARLFQPFSRGEHARLQISGTGLGLYITRRIVQNHHGAISVKSEPGHGSTFTVRLPLTT